MNLSIENDISRLMATNDGSGLVVTAHLADPVSFKDLEDVSVWKDSMRYFDLPGRVQARTSRGMVSSFTWSEQQ